MAKLAQTLGLTDVQTEILSTVRAFVDKEIIPHAQELESSDAYPAEIVEGMKEMGLFGITIPEEASEPMVFRGTVAPHVGRRARSLTSDSAGSTAGGTQVGR